MGIYDRIKNETEHALMRNSEPVNLKSCTVRLQPEYVQLIDKLAEHLDENRQNFLSALIYDAVDEALYAYASVFEDPTATYEDMRKACGLVPKFGLPPIDHDLNDHLDVLDGDFE